MNKIHLLRKSEMVTRGDWLASFVLLIIAIPLSMGIAMASGASPAAGLITAVVGGIVAGALSGAPLVVTGPAAGLVAIVFTIVQQHGLQGLAVITLIAGVIQFALGALRAGGLFTLVPKPVLNGMLAAIGLMILLSQLHVLMGQAVPKSTLLAITTMPRSLASASDLARGWIAPVLACGLLAIAIQVLWPKVFKKLSWLPGALPAIAVATLISLMWEMPRVQIEPIIPSVWSSLQSILSMSWLQNLQDYIVPAMGLAFVASAETLLTARAVDNLAVDKIPGHKPADLNRELFAQGVANSASGLLGGLPVTGVIVRSAANLNAGGKTRWAGILHGVWTALFVSLLPFILTKIPLAALASVLVVTGYKLFNPAAAVRDLLQEPKTGVIWLVTLVSIMMTNLLVGLAIGLGVAFVAHVFRMAVTSGYSIKRIPRTPNKAA